MKIIIIGSSPQMQSSVRVKRLEYSSYSVSKLRQPSTSPLVTILVSILPYFSMAGAACRVLSPSAVQMMAEMCATSKR